jgi:hypothetical protein
VCHGEQLADIVGFTTESAGRHMGQRTLAHSMRASGPMRWILDDSSKKGLQNLWEPL